MKLIMPSIKDTGKMCRIFVLANFYDNRKIRFCVMQFEIMQSLLFFQFELAIRDKKERLNSLPASIYSGSRKEIYEYSRK